MRNTNLSILALVGSLSACGDDAAVAGEDGRLSVEQDTAAQAYTRDAGADLRVEDLACLHGGKVGKIEVAFDCFTVTTVSCKDLSNVVIELADGSRQRFEGLSGQRGVFGSTGTSAGAQIVGVWVKAGSNHSGDGPGYGERFDAPPQLCPPASDAGCLVVDGTCADPTPTPADAGCLVADGTCDGFPSPPPPPPPPPAPPTGF